MENNNDDSSQRGGISVGDTLKKLLATGVSAAFMTEESIRSFVGEMKLPKETLNLLLQGASRSKDEIVDRVTREAIKMLSKIDIVKEASRFVEEHKFKISAEIEVLRKDKDATTGTSTAKNTVHFSASPVGEGETTNELDDDGES